MGSEDVLQGIRLIPEVEWLGVMFVKDQREQTWLQWKRRGMAGLGRDIGVWGEGTQSLQHSIEDVLASPCEEPQNKQELWNQARMAYTAPCLTLSRPPRATSIF